jgi:hypothetical protein
MSKNLELKLNNNDIIGCTISCIGKKCYQPKKIMIYNDNKINISIRNNNKFFVYHIYKSKKDKYSGRWYDLNFNLTKSLNYKNNCLSTKTIFEDIYKDKLHKYNVKIIINFNDKGWKKILKFIE